MKILFFLPNLEGGGAQRVVLNLAAAFGAKGNDVVLVVAVKQGKLLGDIPNNVKLIHLNLSQSLLAILPLTRIIRNEKPDIVFSRMSYANIVTSLACTLSFTKAKVILTIANTLTKYGSYSSFKSRALLFLERVTNIRANVVIANSIDTYNDLLKVKVVAKEKLRIIYNPVVDVDVIAKKLQSKAEHPWLIDKSTPVILSVGRLNKQKNFPMLINAFAIARKTREMRLIILGEGSLEIELRQLIADLNLEDYISLHGFVKNPYPYYKQADLFVLTSLWEGFGNVVVEAMACGCPVIANDCPGGPKEILNYGEFGQVLHGHDIKELAEAICLALDNKKNEELLITRASMYSVDNIVQQYEELFLAL